MNEVALAATVHDPSGRFLPFIQKYIAGIASLFPNKAIAVTSQTNPNVKEILNNNGVRLIQTRENEIGSSRRMSVKLALEFKCNHILYCDFDRMLHWVASYQHELESTLIKIQTFDYFIIGRTKRAFETHPLVQKETERITNHVFQMNIGRPFDVTSGTSAMSKKAAEVILNHSIALSNATDTEWPVIVSRLFSDKIGYVEVEGMEFETPDFFQDEIAESGSYEKWMENLSSDLGNWKERLKLSYESVEAMVPFLERSES